MDMSHPREELETLHKNAENTKALALENFSKSLEQKALNQTNKQEEKRKTAKIIQFYDNSSSLLSLASLALQESEKHLSRLGGVEYKKQLIRTRNVNYHQQYLAKTKQEVEEQRRAVVRKVARELWINFCVRGQESPMLAYLQTNLRKEFGEDLEFYYNPGSIEVMICRKNDDETKQVMQMEKIDIVNKAWKISLDLVDSYTL